MHVHLNGKKLRCFIIVLYLATSFGPECVAIIRSLHKDTTMYSNSPYHQVGDLPYFILKCIVNYEKYMWVWYN